MFEDLSVRGVDIGLLGESVLKLLQHLVDRGRLLVVGDPRALHLVHTYAPLLRGGNDVAPTALQGLKLALHVWLVKQVAGLRRHLLKQWNVLLTLAQEALGIKK